MTLSELVDKLAKEDITVTLSDGTRANCNLTKAAAGRLIEFLSKSILADLLLDGKANFPGIGILKVFSQAPRKFNCGFGSDKVVEKGARKTIKIRPAAELLRHFNG